MSDENKNTDSDSLLTSPHTSTTIWGKRTRAVDEERFLSGRQSKFAEFKRAFRIFIESIQGFRFFHDKGPFITVFGSARFEQNHPYYKLTEETSAQIGKMGYGILTGGGPGLMEAANRGARSVEASSVGCNIKLPKEQTPNSYLDHWMEFNYFFVRKLMLIKYSSAFVVMPGGFGTLDELFETFTLIQTRKIQKFPIVLMGTEYWKPLIEFMDERLVSEGTIDPEDRKIFLLTDDPLEAAQKICAECK